MEAYSSDPSLSLKAARVELLGCKNRGAQSKLSCQALLCFVALRNGEDEDGWLRPHTAEHRNDHTPGSHLAWAIAIGRSHWLSHNLELVVKAA